PMLVQTILELKVQKRGTGFSNEEKGQLIDYIRVLVRQQPLRKLFALFLSDGSSFYVMSFDRDTNEYQEHETTFTLGLRLLYTLIHQKSDFVTAIASRAVSFQLQITKTRSTTTRINLEEFLGEGSSANVYRIKWDNKPAVVKMFSDPSSLEDEVKMLKFLNDSNVQNVPRYVTNDSKNIIIYPVCGR